MFTDGYGKHVPGLDWEHVYQAMRHDAESESHEPMRFGRGDTDDRRRLCYLSIENSDPVGGPDRPGSRSMKYAANDFRSGNDGQRFGSHGGRKAIHRPR